ncbi:hypothetical protein BPMI_03188c [Candidatus Burkholderia pumila]|uniref:Uncharacterized protein n=1 Tax=Candidatus Burkholderia pumila TaxID=1090375 RepID=A0ABR5HNV3_9BURK|nr:hypothetical protein BPMI_03188c [Candidatus Burkholderia pumila]
MQFFYGIGNAHGATEVYFRAASPANVLALIARLERAEGLLTAIASDAQAVTYCQVGSESSPMPSTIKNAAIAAAAPRPALESDTQAVGEVYEHQDGTFRISVQYYGDAPVS